MVVKFLWEFFYEGFCMGVFGGWMGGDCREVDGGGRCCCGETAGGRGDDESVLI